jgi:hypothetical protein
MPLDSFAVRPLRLLAGLLLIPVLIVGVGRAQDADEEPVIVDLTPPAVDVGLRMTEQRAVQIQRQRATITNGQVTAQEIDAYQRQLLLRETVTAVHDSGRPARIVRFYEMWQDGGKRQRQDAWGGAGTSALGSLAGDDRPGSIVTLTLPDGRGTRKLAGASKELTDASKKAVVRARHTDWRPGNRVRVGASWSIAPKKMVAPAWCEPTAAYESGSLKATLTAVGTGGDGRRTATVGISGTVQFLYTEPTHDGTGIAQQARSQVTLSGRAVYDLESRLLLQQRIEGTVQESRNEFGTTVQAAGQFVDAMQRTYSAFITTRDVNLVAKPPAGGDAKPVETGGVTAWPGGPVADGHIVVARADAEAGHHIDVLNPDSGTIQRRIARLPAGASLHDLALSPDRKRIAFASDLNAGISFAQTNLFVVDLTTGTLRQVTPGWADGHGLAKPLPDAPTGTIRGRVFTRSQFGPVYSTTAGLVFVEQTSIQAAINSDGTFTIPNAPVGTIGLMFKAGFPTTAGGEVLIGFLDAVVAPGQITELGDVELNLATRDFGYRAPTFVGNDRLLGEVDAMDWMVDTAIPGGKPDADAPDRAFAHRQLAGVNLWTHLAVEPGGKRIAALGWSTTSRLLHVLDGESGEKTAAFPAWTGPHGLTSVDTGRGVWIPGSDGLILPCTMAGGCGSMPGFLAALLEGPIAEGETGPVTIGLRGFPEWAGGTVRLTNALQAADGATIGFIAETIDAQTQSVTAADLYIWDRNSDAVVRLTAGHTVLSAAW